MSLLEDQTSGATREFALAHKIVWERVKGERDEGESLIWTRVVDRMSLRGPAPAGFTSFQKQGAACDAGEEMVRAFFHDTVNFFLILNRLPLFPYHHVT